MHVSHLYRHKSNNFFFSFPSILQTKRKISVLFFLDSFLLFIYFLLLPPLYPNKTDISISVDCTLYAVVVLIAKYKI